MVKVYIKSQEFSGELVKVSDAISSREREEERIAKYDSKFQKRIECEAKRREAVCKKIAEKEKRLSEERRVREKDEKRKRWNRMLTLVKKAADLDDLRPIAKFLGCSRKALDTSGFEDHFRNLKGLEWGDDGFYECVNYVLKELLISKHLYEEKQRLSTKLQLQKKAEHKRLHDQNKSKSCQQNERFTPVKIGFDVEPAFKPKKILSSEVDIDEYTKSDKATDKSVLYAAGWSVEGAFDESDG